MDAKVAGTSGTAATADARVGAPGADSASDRDASAKILGNISDINSKSKAVGGAGGRYRSGGSGTRGGGILGTGGDVDAQTVANGYRFGVRKCCSFQNAAAH
jgi:hypothetical protein